MTTQDQLNNHDVIRFARQFNMPGQGRFIHSVRLGRLGKAYSICLEAVETAFFRLSHSASPESWEIYEQLTTLRTMIARLLAQNIRPIQ